MEAFRFDALTDRQRECLRLLATGMQHKEIAAALAISPRTVETHLTEAVRRLGGGNSRSAARLLVEHEGNPPGFAPTGSTRMAENQDITPIPEVPGEVASVTLGRVIKWGYLDRSLMMFGLSIALIFSLFILIAGVKEAASIVRIERPFTHR